MNAKKYKIILPVLVLVVLVIYLAFFRQGQINSRDVKTGPDFLQYLDQKGTRNISWADFDHLPHENIAPEGYGNGPLIRYQLTDGYAILLHSDSMDQPPTDITLVLK